MPETEALIEALATGVRQLTQEERSSSAERMAVLLLTVDEQDARSRYARLAPGLAPVESEDLASLSLGHMQRRVISEWPQWLDSIGSATIKKLQSGGALLGALANHLWQKAAVDTEPPPPDERGEALRSLARLTEETRPELDALRELMLQTIGGPPLDDAAAAAQGGTLAIAVEFDVAGVIEGSFYSVAALDALSGALEHPLQAGIALDSPLVQHIATWGPQLSTDADRDSRARLRAAAEASPWLPSPARESLVIAVAAAIQTVDGEDTNPYGTAEVGALVDLHGTGFAAGLAAWIEHLAKTPGDVASAVHPLVGEPLPGDVAGAISQRAGGWDPSQRTELLEPSLRDALRVMPDNSFLGAAHYSEGDHEATAELLVDLYQRATNNGDRSGVLVLWEALGETADPVRRRLINDVAIPMAHQGKGALNLVLDHLSVALPPPRGTLQALRKTLRERAKGKDQKKRVDTVLLDAGLTRRSGLLGRGRKDAPEADA